MRRQGAAKRPRVLGCSWRHHGIAHEIVPSVVLAALGGTMVLPTKLFRLWSDEKLTNRWAVCLPSSRLDHWFASIFSAVLCLAQLRLPTRDTKLLCSGSSPSEFLRVSLRFPQRVALMIGHNRHCDKREQASKLVADDG